MDFEEELKRARKFAAQLTPDKEIQEEAVSLSLEECFLNKRKIFKKLVRWRVLDLIRKREKWKEKYKEKPLSFSVEIPSTDETFSDLPQFINDLLKKGNLTREQRYLIFMRFYREDTVEEISKVFNTSPREVSRKLEETLQTLWKTSLSPEFERKTNEFLFERS